jgi:hypothetical protein
MNSFLSKKDSPKKLLTRHTEQPYTLTRQEYKSKNYVKNIKTNLCRIRNRIRIRNKLKSRIRIQKKIIPDPQPYATVYFIPQLGTMNLATYTMYNMHEENNIGDIVTEQLNTNHNCVHCVLPFTPTRITAG